MEDSIDWENWAVQDWLKEIGMSKYENAFIDNGYDTPELVASLKKEDLDAIGVTKKKDRSTIFNQATKLKERVSKDICLNDTPTLLFKGTSPTSSCTFSSMQSPEYSEPWSSSTEPHETAQFGRVAATNRVTPLIFSPISSLQTPEYSEPWSSNPWGTAQSSTLGITPPISSPISPLQSPEYSEPWSSSTEPHETAEFGRSRVAATNRVTPPTSSAPISSLQSPEYSEPWSSNPWGTAQSSKTSPRTSSSPISSLQPSEYIEPWSSITEPHGTAQIGSEPATNKTKSSIPSSPISSLQPSEYIEPWSSITEPHGTAQISKVSATPPISVSPKQPSEYLEPWSSFTEPSGAAASTTLHKVTPQMVDEQKKNEASVSSVPPKKPKRNRSRKSPPSPDVTDLPVFKREEGGTGLKMLQLKLKIRDELEKDGIILTEPPYSEGNTEQLLMDLAAKYAEKFGAESLGVYNALLDVWKQANNTTEFAVPASPKLERFDKIGETHGSPESISERNCNSPVMRSVRAVLFHGDSSPPPLPPPRRTPSKSATLTSSKSEDFPFPKKGPHGGALSSSSSENELTPNLLRHQRHTETGGSNVELNKGRLNDEDIKQWIESSRSLDDLRIIENKETPRRRTVSSSKKVGLIKRIFRHKSDTSSSRKRVTKQSVRVRESVAPVLKPNFTYIDPW